MSWLPDRRPWTLADGLRVGFGSLALVFAGVILPAWARTYSGSVDPMEWQKDGYQLWLAAGHFTRGEWAGLYTSDFSQGRYFWLYPPFALWLVAPLAALPAGAAYVVVVAMQTVATFASVHLLGADRTGDGMTARLGTLGSAAFVSVIVVGQSSGLLALIAVGSASALAADRDVLAGLLIGALVVKPNWLAPFLLTLLLRKRWRALGAVAGVCALALLSTLPLGTGLWHDFAVSSRGYAQLVADRYDVWKLITLHAFWRSTLAPGWVTPTWLVSEALVGAAYVA